MKLPIALLLFSITLSAQQAPLSPPPPVLLMHRELIRPGKRADVLGIERLSVQNQAELKSPHTYLALTSITGPDCIWWLNGFDSYAAIDEEHARISATPGLLKEWARTPTLKADLIVDNTPVYARFRDDLSYGRGVTGTRTRFLLITTVTINPGHGADFAEIRKIIRAGHERARAADNLCVYQVESGMPDGTFFIFSSASNMDEAGALSQFHGRGLENALNDSARTQLRTLSAAAILKSETALYAVDPEISFPAREWMQSDPQFWSVNAIAK